MSGEEKLKLATPRRVLALASGGNGGDFPPVAGIALGLAARGHAVRFLGDRAIAAALAGTGAETVVIDPGHEWLACLRRWREADGRDGRAAPPPFPLPEWSADVTPLALRAAAEFAPGLILSTLFCSELASRTSAATGIPWCLVNPSFYFGPGAVRSAASDYAGPVIPLRTNYWLPLAGTASLVLHATDPEFDFAPAVVPAGHRYVGPQLWEPPAAPPPYLDAPGPPWVLATLSQAPQPGEHRLAAAALEALAARPLRVVMTRAGERPGAGRGELPESIHLTSHVPHLAVLERSRLFVSHAGHGAVMKALCSGVPMVLVPLGRDQPGVAARAERLGVARVLSPEGLDARRLGDAIDEVLEDGRYLDEARRSAERLRRTDWTAVACRAIEDHAAESCGIVPAAAAGRDG